MGILLKKTCTFEFCLDVLNFDGSPVQLVILDQSGEPLLNEPLEEPGLQYCFTLEVLEGVEELQFRLVSIDGGSFLIDNPTLHSACTQGVQVANVMSTQDYYPFGSIMPGRSFNSGDYRYGFQGQEQDYEVKGAGNSVNYKCPMHDPRIGRFFSVDLLARKYPYYSSYQFSGNRVIDMIELEGLEPTQPRYMWKATDVEHYRHGTMMKVEGWWVFHSVNNEAEDVHQYRDPNKEVWKEFTPAQPSCLSCELDDLFQLGLQKTADVVGPTSLILGGVIAVAASIPSGGTSVGAYGAVVTASGITFGTYSIAAGTSKLTLNLADKKDLADKIPNGYLNSTVGLVVKRTVDNKEVMEVIDVGLSITEGTVTFKFTGPSDIQKISNAASVTFAAKDLAELNKALQEDIEKQKDIKKSSEEE